MPRRKQNGYGVMPEEPTNDGVKPDGQSDAPQDSDVTSAADASAGEPEAPEQQADSSVTPEPTEAEKERLLRTIENQRRVEREAKAEAKKMADELAQARKRIEEFEREKMSEEERREADFNAMKERASELEAALEAREAKIRDVVTDNALIAAMSKPEAGIVDAQAALKLLDRSALEYDDDGRPTTESVQGAIEGLIEAYPFMKAQKRASVGEPSNPSRDLTPPQKTDAQMRDEIYGRSHNIFDPVAAADHGGGVVYNPKHRPVT